MSSAARVHRLEAYYKEQRYWASDASKRDEALEAIHRNSADLAQYALVYGDEIASYRESIKPAIPVLLALRHLNDYLSAEFLVIPTVSPDQPLPRDMQQHLEFLEWRALLPQREAARLGRQVDRWNPAPGELG